MLIEQGASPIFWIHYVSIVILSTFGITNLMSWCRFIKTEHETTKQQLYGHLPPITKTIQVRWTRHAGHCWRSRDELISDVLLWTPSHGRAKAGRPARTYIQQLCEDPGVALRTCRKRWTIGTGSARGSGISVFMARQDDHDDSFTNFSLFGYFIFQFLPYIYRSYPIQQHTAKTAVKILW